MSLDAANISHYLAILNSLIAASVHTEEYRQMVAAAIAEGRDISNDELASVAKRVQDNIEAAQVAAKSLEEGASDANH